MSLVVHGHAHRGQLEGATQSGVPVYNVSMPLLTRTFADRPPFRVFEVPVAEPAAERRAARARDPPVRAHGGAPADAVAS